MGEPGRSYCPRCGARLRRGQPFGSECDPCRRALWDRHLQLPWAGSVPQTWKTALADYDFQALFAQVRAQTGWSQQTLGGVVDLTQSQVSAIERGICKLTHVRLVAGVAQGLHIPGHLLGFPEFSTQTNSDPARE